MIIGRRTEFIEVFDIDMDVYGTMRTDEDFCRRLMLDADPILTQQIKCGEQTARKGIKMISRTLDKVGDSVFPVPKEFLKERFDLPKVRVEDTQ